jgi:hypothetical protein
MTVAAEPGSPSGTRLTPCGSRPGASLPPQIGKWSVCPFEPITPG